MDCVSDDLSLLLAHHGVKDVEEPLSSDWRFQLQQEPHGLVRVLLPAPGLEERIAARTGLRLTWHTTRDVEDAARQWGGHLEHGRPVLVVGDAFHLPWLPYHGHQHMDHGFVVDGAHGSLQRPRNLVLDVTDPYDNATRWGAAKPLSTTVTLDALAPALRGSRWGVLHQDGPGEGKHSSAFAYMTDNLRALRSAFEEKAYRHLLGSLDEQSPASWDHYSLQTWLLSRSRALHSRWLGAHADEWQALRRNGKDLPVLFDEQVTEPWKRAAQACYLAFRRTSSGKSVPPSARESLEFATASEGTFVDALSRQVL
ncbi:hypothetical protein GCM10023336_70130 [Streptomyces similanensis]|uniref:Butirosin biosynthesis protein H N-terminal domain-containing protein n=2 Tax=Streptomyces similanensis TaxID=1274988 RepID=A0ABP9LMH2_9ACTN